MTKANKDKAQPKRYYLEEAKRILTQRFVDVSAKVHQSISQKFAAEGRVDLRFCLYDSKDDSIFVGRLLSRRYPKFSEALRCEFRELGYRIKVQFCKDKTCGWQYVLCDVTVTWERFVL